MINQFFNSLLFVAITFLCQATYAQLEVPPRHEWKTLHTPHFEVIHNAKQQDLGRLYAEKLEEAYFALQPYFKSFPQKTVVIINDKTDITNGYATRLPYPHIMAYPVLPGPEDSLSDIGDWAFELLVHEYTHILNFEPANGIMVPLRTVFGNVIAPNILLPNWWKEGLAVELETRTGTHGRLRSSYQDSLIRSFVLDSKLDSFTIAQANESIPSWPRGMRPYIFGSLFWSYLLEKGDTSLVADLNERQGGRVPYFIETPFSEKLGQSYEKFYAEMLKDLELKTQGQLQTLRSAPTTPLMVSNQSWVSMSAPAISPNGRYLAIITESDAGSRSIKLIERSKDETSFYDSKYIRTVDDLNEALEPLTQEPTLGGSIQRVSWFPNSEIIIYDKIDATNRIERFSDLYIYDLGIRKLKKLTQAARAREPGVSPRGDRIAFVKLEGGKTHLAELSGPDFKTETILFSSEFQSRISYPSYLNDEQIIFSLRLENGDEYLHILEVSDRSIRKVLTDFPNSRFAKSTHDGVIFTSSRNGVPNLYLADEELLTARPLTHVLTAVFSGDIDPLKKELYLTTMTANGNRIAAVKADDWNKTAELPKVAPLLAQRYGDNSEAIALRKSQAQQALASSQTEDYSAAGYLWPRYWIPFVSGTSTDTGVILSAQTSGFDPLKKHSYSVAASWDTAQNTGSLQASYLNQTTSLPFALLGYQRTTYLGTISNEVKDYGANIFVLPDVFALSRYANLQLGWQYLQRSYLDTQTNRMGPSFMMSYANYSMAGNQISPESGGSVYAGATHYFSDSSYLNHTQVNAGGQAYTSKWLPQYHSIMLKLDTFHIPEKVPSVYGVSTEPVVFNANSSLPQYILRGYKRGQLYGRNLATLNAEYRFPIARIYNGSGTDPLFLKRFSAAIVADGAVADGVFINDIDRVAEPTTLERSFWSAGGEFKVDTTIGYVIPATFIVGYYIAFNAPEGATGVLATTLQVTGF